jgi:hypothetical protein
MYRFIRHIINLYNYKNNFKFIKNFYVSGNGDWGLGIGDWGLGIGPNPQSPIPNPHPQSPFEYFFEKILL